MTHRISTRTSKQLNGKFPHAIMMSESIKLYILLHSEAPYEEQVALTAQFLRNLPKNSHYDVNGSITQLMQNVMQQLGIKRQRSFKMSMPRDIQWERGIQVMKDLSLHDVPAIAKAAGEQLKQLRLDHDTRCKPLEFATQTLTEDDMNFRLSAVVWS